MTDFPDVLADLKYEDFSFQKPLGKGNFGEVHKAYCEKLNGVVAVKIISVLSTDSKLEDSKAKIIEEIKILIKNAAHDNVISIKDVIKPVNEKEDKYWIVMEFCDYNVQEIRDKLPDNRIPWARWVTVMKDILAGLIFLHGKEFVHCDLKPENVLVNDRFEAKIGDVGLSRTAGESYDSSAKSHLDLVLPSGTLQYISPERLQDPHKAPAFADDYYSCGLLFYKMITNENLFHLEDTAHCDDEARIARIKLYVCERNYRHSFKILKDSPEEIATAIGILWDVDPINRIAGKAQKEIYEAIIRHGYDKKETLEKADKDLKNLMDHGIVPGAVGSVDFDDIAKLEGISNWKPFAIQGLRLKAGDLQEIEVEHKKFHDQKVAMLKRWQDINRQNATVDELEKALLKCNLKLAAQKLKKIGLQK